MNNVISFLKSIKSTDGVIVIFHNDADGICSSVLLRKYLDTIVKKAYMISQPMPPDKNLIRRIQTCVPSKIIMLDLAVDQQESLIKKIKGISDVLIVDHHPSTRNFTAGNAVYYNPRYKNPKIYQSVSYLMYKILSKITDVSDSAWISAIGIIGDYDTSSSKDVLEEVEKKYPIELFNKIAAMIEGVKATKAMSCEQMVEIILNTKDPNQLLESGSFLDSYQKMQNEMAAIMIDIQASLEKIDNILFYQLKSRFNLRSTVATKLSEKYPDKLVIVYERMDKRIAIAARNQARKLNCDKILRYATRGLRASAGGHEAASGATIEAKDWDVVKGRLIEYLTEKKE
ncbi:MAG: DHH family phosphoesterase [Candidatus Aenigmatarchaeota archaeon]